MRQRWSNHFLSMLQRNKCCKKHSQTPCCTAWLPPFWRAERILDRGQAHLLVHALVMHVAWNARIGRLLISDGLGVSHRRRRVNTRSQSGFRWRTNEMKLSREPGMPGSLETFISFIHTWMSWVWNGVSLCVDFPQAHRCAMQAQCVGTIVAYIDW